MFLTILLGGPDGTVCIVCPIVCACGCACVLCVYAVLPVSIAIGCMGPAPDVAPCAGNCPANDAATAVGLGPTDAAGTGWSTIVYWGVEKGEDWGEGVHVGVG